MAVSRGRAHLCAHGRVGTRPWGANGHRASVAHACGGVRVSPKEKEVLPLQTPRPSLEGLTPMRSVRGSKTRASVGGLLENTQGQGTGWWLPKVGGRWASWVKWRKVPTSVTGQTRGREGQRADYS